MAQLLKNVPYKHENLTLILKTHTWGWRDGPEVRACRGVVVSSQPSVTLVHRDLTPFLDLKSTRYIYGVCTYM